MSYVDVVKEKHRFEQSLRDLSRYLNVMSIEELELAMAHIADDVVAEPDEARSRNGSIKGAALMAYVELRTAGQIAQSKIRRMTYRSEMKRYFERMGTARREADIASRMERLERLRHDHAMAMADHRKAYSQWARDREALPFLRRLFYWAPQPPPPPTLPYPEDLIIYVKREQQRGTLEEFFVGVVRHFELQGLPTAPVKFSPEEMAFLSK